MENVVILGMDTIGRDVLFIIGMYVEVSVTMLLAYGMSCIEILSAERR